MFSTANILLKPFLCDRLAVRCSAFNILSDAESTMNEFLSTQERLYPGMVLILMFAEVLGLYGFIVASYMYTET